VSGRLRSAVIEVAVGIQTAIAQNELLEQRRNEERQLLESRARLIPGNAHPSGPPPVPRSLQTILFDLLCCMMAADGSVSPAEIKKINQIMSKFRPGWTEEHGRTRVTAFVNEIKKSGYTPFLERALSDLPQIKQQGRGRTLIKCMEAVSNADGTRSAREDKLLDRVRNALSG
jgi:uncharacterized tellurite resistance protein B-like protein